MIANGVKTIRQIISTVSREAIPLRPAILSRSRFLSGWNITASIAAHKMAE